MEKVHRTQKQRNTAALPKPCSWKNLAEPILQFRSPFFLSFLVDCWPGV